jgi:glycosyltransferase involved in cell wall biosynthesis
VLEAMASGMPVVVTPYIGLSSDIGVTEKQYLLAERDAGSLAGAMERLLLDESLRLSLGRSGRAWVAGTMSLERSLDRYAALYLELAGGAPLR